MPSLHSWASSGLRTSSNAARSSVSSISINRRTAVLFSSIDMVDLLVVSVWSPHSSGSFSTDMAIPHPAHERLANLETYLPCFGRMAIFVTNDPLVGHLSRTSPFYERLSSYLCVHEREIEWPFPRQVTH